MRFYQGQHTHILRTYLNAIRYKAGHPEFYVGTGTSLLYGRVSLSRLYRFVFIVPQNTICAAFLSYCIVQNSIS